MADSILRDKSKAFAKDIVFLCRQLRESRVEGVLINQLLKSGTSVGANVCYNYKIKTINWLTSARKPLEIQGFRAFMRLREMSLQHFCNSQWKKHEKKCLQVVVK